MNLTPFVKPLIKGLTLSTFLLLGACAENVETETQTSQTSDSKQKLPIRSINTQEAQAVIDEVTGVEILDVRTAREYKGGHIANATQLDFYADDFTAQLKKYDKNKRYLVYCASGGRSSETLLAMKKMGFTNVLNLEGGFQSWKQADLPIEK